MFEKLGHYNILDRIGAGGMGEVYRARDTRLDRTVAIKILTVGSAKLTFHVIQPPGSTETRSI